MRVLRSQCCVRSVLFTVCSSTIIPPVLHTPFKFQGVCLDGTCTYIVKTRAMSMCAYLSYMFALSTHGAGQVSSSDHALRAVYPPHVKLLLQPVFLTVISHSRCWPYPHYGSLLTASHKCTLLHREKQQKEMDISAFMWLCQLQALKHSRKILKELHSIVANDHAPWPLHNKKEKVTLTLLRLSQLQLNDIMSPPHSVSISLISLRLIACVECVGCPQSVTRV